MASNYPTSLDSFNNPSGTDSLNSPSHSLQHSDINDAVEAIEAKLGIGASPAGSATAGQVLTAQGGGTALWATPALVHLNTTTFSAVASQSINDVFSASYKTYKIFFNFIGSANALITVRMRVAGSDASGASDYRYANYGWNTGGSGSPTASTGTSSFNVVNVGSSARCSAELTFFNPFETINTTFTGSGWAVDTSLSVETGFRVGGRHAQNVSYDGFNTIASTGNITGQISVFGVKE